LLLSKSFIRFCMLQIFNDNLSSFIYILESLNNASLITGHEHRPVHKLIVIILSWTVFVLGWFFFVVWVYFVNLRSVKTHNDMQRIITYNNHSKPLKSKRLISFLLRNRIERRIIFYSKNSPCARADLLSPSPGT